MLSSEAGSASSCPGLCVLGATSISPPGNWELPDEDGESELRGKPPPQLCALGAEPLAQVCLIKSSSLVTSETYPTSTALWWSCHPCKGTAQGRQGNDGGFAADVSDGLSIPDTFLSHAADLLSLGSVLNRF